MSDPQSEGTLARSLCWHCQSDVGGEYFCTQCVKIQPIGPELDFFGQFGLPRRLNLDLNDLEKRFYDLSRRFHPDFFQKSTEQEQTISLENAAVLNTAYRTLKDPIRRVEYLISLEEGAVKDIPAKAPPDLLEEILELQEALETYQRSKGFASDTISDLKKTLLREQERIRSRKEDLEKELFGLFQEWDRLPDRYEAEGSQEQRKAMLKRMKDILSARVYLRTLLEDLEEGLGDDP